ncbi:MAG: hypothetical protein K6T83_05640 [Alicyclobacillus sp.]|nr:hypothetical protein [Alicyclobacillus sp.]
MKKRFVRNTLYAVTTTVLTAGTLCLAAPSSALANNSNGIFTETATWPIPPQYQGNPYASGGVGPTAVIFENLIQGIRMSNAYYFRLAQSIQNTKTETIVHLRPDVKWSDGQPFTSKDVAAVYTLDAQGQQLDNFITGIQTPDDHTVIFKWLSPYPNNQTRLFLLEQAQMNIPYHYYKQWVDKAVSILNAAPKYRGGINNVGLNYDGHSFTKKIQNDWTKNWNDFLKHGPKFPIGTGPYMIKEVTPTDMVDVPNPYYWDKKDFAWKMIHYVQLNSASANEQYNLLTAGKIDRVDGTPPESLLVSELKSNPAIVHYQMQDAATLGFVFNLQHSILQNVNVRKAIIYALNKQKITQVSNVYGTTVPWAGVGMPPSELNNYVPKSVQKKLTKYNYNPALATKLLESAGWKKVKGQWTYKGKVVHLTVAADAAWNPQWLNAGEVIAEQLTSFGLNTSFRAIQDSVYWSQFGKKAASSADMGMNWVDVSWGNTNAWNSMTSTFSQMNSQAGIPLDKNKQLEINVKGADGKKIVPNQVLNQVPFIKSEAQQKQIYGNLAYVINENAWQCDIYQNVTGAWFYTTHVTGLPWPDGIKKYNRNVPVPPAKYTNAIAILNEGFSSEMMYAEIKPN